MWLCPAAEAKLIRSNEGIFSIAAAETKLIRSNLGIFSIAQWMVEEVQRDPEIRTAIVRTRLLQWADNLPMLPIQTDSVALQQDAIQHQDAIGWDTFLEGHIAKDWEQAHDS